MIVWTIYERPRDFPTAFVLRPHYAGPGYTHSLAYHATAPTLKAIRAKVPYGMVRIPAQPGDDPVIVETWI